MALQRQHTDGVEYVVGPLNLLSTQVRSYSTLGTQLHPTCIQKYTDACTISEYVLITGALIRVREYVRTQHVLCNTVTMHEEDSLDCSSATTD